MPIPSVSSSRPLAPVDPVISLRNGASSVISSHRSFLTIANPDTFFGKIKSYISSFFGKIKSFSNYLLSFFKKTSKTKDIVKDFKVKLDRVDHLSEELALSEADESENLIVYHELGKQVLKESWQIVWKKIYVPLIGLTFVEIGKKAAKEDYKALFPYLKRHYESEIARLKIKFNSN